MENYSEYVNTFVNYINNFIVEIRPNDPLPVRASSFKITENEIDGRIIDIVYHYLNHKTCPPYIKNIVAHRVWSSIRQPLSGTDEADDAGESVCHGNHTYEHLELIKDVTDRVNEEMKNLQTSLTPSEIEALPKYLPVSQYAIKNTRRKMEDRNVIIQDLNALYNLNFGQPHAYYAVFDGHAGCDAAVYSAALLHQYLIQNPLYEMDPASALKHAFHITDTNFVKKTEKEKLKGGTTAVVALVREKRLVVAWLGDSLALLVRRRNPVHIVRPHKPDDPNEQKRIENAGGVVVNIQGTWRVLGQLAVSRAIGDAQCKPYVTSECDIKSLEIGGDEDFLILACDGLWDNLKPETAVDIVFSYLLKNDGDTDGVGRCLVEAARESGSEDNITAVVVFLRSVDVLMEEESARVAQGLVPEMDAFVLPQKGALPPSFQGIFTPPERLKSVVATNGDHRHSPGPEEVEFTPEVVMSHEEVPPEIPPRDYDSDEGVGEKPASQSPSGRVNGIQPTDEEVDAALAELDSIPDEDMAAEGEDLDGEEEEGWSYYKMEPQLEPKQVEELLATTESCVDDVAVSHEGADTASAPTAICVDVSAYPKEPSPSGSPRSVEGFITSVELNTPEETFNTNLAINQTSEYFGVHNVEQNSGPFSVYVSSSPEPVSVEATPVDTLSRVEAAESVSLVEKSHADVGENTLVSAVEIVHAQSTVEVMTGNVVEMEIQSSDGLNPMADVMNSSPNGDLPTESLIPPVMDDVAPPMEVKQPLDVITDIDKLSLNRSPEPSPDPLPVSPLQISSPDTCPIEDKFDKMPDLLGHTQDSSLLQDQRDENLIETDVPRPEILSETVAPSAEYAAYDTVSPDEVSEDADLEARPVSDDPVRMESEIPVKSFEVSLDPMAASFHEDQIPSSDLVSSLKESSVSVLEEELVNGDIANVVKQTESLEIHGSVTESAVCESLIETQSNVIAPKEEEVVSQEIAEAVADAKVSKTEDQPLISPCDGDEAKIDIVTERKVEPAPNVEMNDRVATQDVAADASVKASPKKAAAPRTSAPKAFPRTSQAKTAAKPATKPSTSREPVASSTFPKRVPSATKTQRKTTELNPKPSASAVTRKTTTTSATRAISTTTKTTTSRTSLAPLKKPKSTTPSTIALTNAPPKSSVRVTSATLKSKPAPATTTSSAPKRVPLSTRPPAASSRLSATGFKTTAGAETAKNPAAASRIGTSSATTKRSSITTKTTSTLSSASSNRLSLSSRTTVASKTTSTATSKSAPSNSTKETKNSTNRILSANTAAKPRTLPSKYAKTPILKKKDSEKCASAAAGASALANGHGESKAAKDAATVESAAKLVEAGAPAPAAENVLVNGDH